MHPYMTPKARPRRYGIWSSPLLFAAVRCSRSCFPRSCLPRARRYQSQILRNSSLQATPSIKPTPTAEHRAGAGRTGKQLDTAGPGCEWTVRSGRSKTTSTRPSWISRTSAPARRPPYRPVQERNTWSYYYLQALVSEDDLASVLDRLEMVTRVASQDQKLFRQWRPISRIPGPTRSFWGEERRAAERARPAGAGPATDVGQAAQFATSYEALQGQLGLCASRSSRPRRWRRQRPPRLRSCEHRGQAAATASNRSAPAIRPTGAGSGTPTRPRRRRR